MTKKELINNIMEHSNVDKKTVETVLDSFAFILKENLIQEEKIVFGNLGNFNVKIRQARKAQNLKTGEEIDVPQKRVVKFTPSKYLKEVVDF